jgi:N-methylhydantoinase B
MEALIERTAMSAFIREKKDFYAGLFDAKGRFISGKSRPGSSDLIGPILEQYPADGVRAGDLYWYNDCYAARGAVSHSPDQVLAAPVFHDGRLVAWSQAWAHFSDIGGSHAGSISPACTEIWQEGIIVPPVRLATGGTMNDELLRLFLRNSRFPDMMEGDTRAMMAATRIGQSRLTELFERYGEHMTEACFEELLARSEAVVRRNIAAHSTIATIAHGTSAGSDARIRAANVITRGSRDRPRSLRPARRR